MLILSADHIYNYLFFEHVDHVKKKPFGIIACFLFQYFSLHRLILSIFTDMFVIHFINILQLNFVLHSDFLKSLDLIIFLFLNTRISGNTKSPKSKVGAFFEKMKKKSWGGIEAYSFINSKCLFSLFLTLENGLY